jgi:uroporphyrinogen decarboxylase
MNEVRRNMKSWAREIIAAPTRHAIPVMTHPGVEFIGKSVFDVVTDGQIHFEALKAVNDHYPSAAATTVMDLTVEAEAFGAPVHFSPEEIPAVTGSVVSNREEIEALQIPDLSLKRLPEYLKASRLAARNIDKPVFSGCIGPFSLAGRLFDMTEIMTTCYLDPDLVHLLLQKCTDFLLTWVQALKATGTSGVVMAEPAAGLLDGDFCAEFSSRYVKQIVDNVQDDHFLLILHNCGNTGQCTEAMLATGAAGLHFGNAIDMKPALEQCPRNILVMGNIDPVRQFKMASPEELYQITSDLLEKTKAYPNFILSSGCDTPPGTPLANIDAFYRALGDFNLRMVTE